MNNLKHYTRNGYPGKTFARFNEALKKGAALPEALQHLVDSLSLELHADACFIFINETGAVNGAVHTILKHWYVKDGRPKFDTDADLKQIELTLYPEVFASLLKREPVTLSKFQPLEPQAAALLLKTPFQTCLLQPVFIGAAFWGIIGLGQLSPKNWALPEYMALQFISTNIAWKLEEEQLARQLELKNLMHQTAMESFDELRWEFNIADKQLTLYGSSPYLKITSDRQLNFNVLKAIQDHVFPADRGRLIHLYVTLLQATARTQVQDTFRILINKEGAFKWVHINLVALPDASGFAGMVTGKLSGATALKNASDTPVKQAAKETHFRFITENITDCITVLNRSGDVIYMAPSGKEVFGLTPASLINQSMISRIHPDYKEPFIRQLLQADDSNAQGQYSYRFRVDNDHYIWIETIARPVVNEQGVINAYLCINRNMHQKFRLLEEAESTLLREKLQYHQQSRTIAENTIEIGLSADDLQSGLDVLKLYTAAIPEPGNQLFEKQFERMEASLASIREKVQQLNGRK